MLALTASLFLFLALVTACVAFVAPARLGRRASEARIRALGPARDAESSRTPAPAFRRSRSSIPAFRRFLSDSSWADAIALDLQQANVQLRVGEYLLLRLVLAALGFGIALLLLRGHLVGLLVALAAGVLGYVAPSLCLKFLRQRRVAAIEKQLVEFLPMLASSLRAGFSFQHGVEAAANQLGPPFAHELGALLSDVNLGAPMQSALLDMGRRVGSADLDMLITAVLVQRTTGGNLAEILDQAGETLRERERIRGELQTLTAQQRLTGLILSLYPVAVGLLLLAIMPGVWSKLFTETVGQVQLGIAVALQLTGFFFIRRILRIDI